MHKDGQDGTKNDFCFLSMLKSTIPQVHKLIIELLRITLSVHFFMLKDELTHSSSRHLNMGMCFNNVDLDQTGLLI